MNSKKVAAGSAVAVSLLGLGVVMPNPATALSVPYGPMNPYEAAVCALDNTKCFFTITSATATLVDTSNRTGQNYYYLAVGDGNRNNAFLHSSWSARASVVTKDRNFVRTFTTAHEQPLTSGNPAGTNEANRHEHMDLCNNKWGSNRPSNSHLLFNDQMTSVNQLWNESRAMQEDGVALEALLPNDTCSGIRLYFIRKDNGNLFV